MYLISRFLVGIAGTLLVVQASASEVLSRFGTAFVFDKEKIEFKVPQRSFTKLPERLPVYIPSKSRSLPALGVEWMIEHSALSAEQKKALTEKVEENPAALATGRTILLRDGGTNVILNPDQAMMGVKTPAPEKIAYRLPSERERQATLAPDVFRKAVIELLSALGWASDEIQRKPNGQFQMQVSDLENYPNRQREPVVVERTATFYRQLQGFPVVSTEPFQIKLTRLVTGEWREVFVYWPELKEESVIERKYKSNNDLKASLAAKDFYWDYGNNFAPEDVERIKITDVRLVYFHAKGTGLEPALVLDATLQGENGTEDGVLYLPLSSGQD